MEIGFVSVAIGASDDANDCYADCDCWCDYDSQDDND